MMRINVNIYPPDGYSFTLADGTIIRGKSWSDVITRVGRYRRRNRIQVGNPTDEVHAQACQRNPSACQASADEPTKRAIRVATLKGRVLAWISGLRRRKEPLVFVDEATMRARAAVCAGCPAHASVAGGCGSCKRVVKEARLVILGSKPQAAEISGCTHLGEDCVVNTWLQEPLSADPTLPKCCWRRTGPS